MKFSKCLPLAALASLAAAVPAPFSVSVNVNDESILNSIHKSGDACTKACLPEKIDCGEGSYAWEESGCWSCCTCSSCPDRSKKDAKSFTTSLVTQGVKEVSKFHAENMPVIHKSFTDRCWRFCGFDLPPCPEGWYPRRLGECWTCCKANELPAKTHAEVELFAVDF